MVITLHGLFFKLQYYAALDYFYELMSATALDYFYELMSATGPNNFTTNVEIIMRFNISMVG